MNVRKCKLKTSFYAVVLLLCVALTPAFAQTVSTESPATPTSPIVDVNHLIDNPTLITLHFKDAPLLTVIDELAKQAGIELNPPLKTLDLENRTISIDIDHQPFWMAVRAISKASKINLSIYPSFNPSVWGYTRDATLNSPYYVLQGPFLIVADSIFAQRNSITEFQFGGIPFRKGKTIARITISCYVDPNLSVIGFPQNFEPEQIVDEKGNSLMGISKNSQHGFQGGADVPLLPDSFLRPRSGDGISIDARISNPPSPFRPFYLYSDADPRSSAALDLSHDYGKRIAVFKGNLRFLQSKTSSTWEVPNILNAKGTTKTITCNGIPIHFVINDVTQKDNVYKVRMTMSWHQPSSPNQPNYYLGRQLQFAMLNVDQSMHLLDSKGNLYFSGGRSSGGDGGINGFYVDASFQKSRAGFPVKYIPGVPTKLVIEVPTELTEIKVPFKFTNLPLPQVK